MNKTLQYGAIILGILFFVAGYIYATRSASALPSFFPGHDATMTAKHTKHAIGAFVLGVGCFVLAWFQSGPKKSLETK